jgi:hypothetical protein
MRCGAFPPYCRLCAPVEEIQLFARASSKQGKTNRLRLSLETSLTKLIQTRVPTRCIANQIRVPYSSSWITSYNNCGSSRQKRGEPQPQGTRQKIRREKHAGSRSAPICALRKKLMP